MGLNLDMDCLWGYSLQKHSVIGSNDIVALSILSAEMLFNQVFWIRTSVYEF